MLLLHEVNDIAAEQHLHLCIPVLEKLVQTYFHLVIEQIDQYVDNRLHELEVVQVDRVWIDPVREEVALDCLRAPEKRIVQYFQVNRRMAVLRTGN